MEVALELVLEALKNMGGSGDPEQILEDLDKVIDTKIRHAKLETLVHQAVASIAHDPADILPRLDWDGLELEGNTVKNLPEMLGEIQRAKPYLFQSAQLLTGGHVATSATAPTAPLDALTMEEYAAYRTAKGGCSQR